MKGKKKNVNRSTEAKKQKTGHSAQPASVDPDIPQRNWRYPWEKAWREGLVVRWT